MTHTRIEVDLAAIGENVNAIRAHLGDGVEIMGVVKANAYGHGLVPVAKTLQKAGVGWLAVNRWTEGKTLRDAGLTGPVLVLGHTLPSDMAAVVAANLTPTITERNQAQALSELVVANNQEHPVHVKVDTGMSRLGVLPEEAVAFIQQVHDLPGLRVEGVFSHLSVADSALPEDIAFTQRQHQLFEGVLAELATTSVSNFTPHLANGGGVLWHPETHYQLVRPGQILYGLKPNHRQDLPIDVKPALKLISYVAAVKKLSAGTDVSYGRTFTTTRPTTMALVPVGYGDGYHRRVSPGGYVLIGGHKAPIMGRVCMDQFVVDVTDIDGASLEDEAVLIGRQGDEEITAEMVAEWAGTINYETTASLLTRIPRETS